MCGGAERCPPSHSVVSRKQRSRRKMSGIGSTKVEVRPKQPLLDELRAIGIPLAMIWETNHIKKMPPQALKLILHHLRSDYPRKAREGMARALGRREARAVVWEDVVALYREEYDEPAGRVKEGLASAIHEMARPADVDTLIELLKDTKNGGSRIFFVRNLARTSSARAFEALYELQNDPDLQSEIVPVLKRRKAQLLVPRITSH